MVQKVRLDRWRDHLRIPGGVFSCGGSFCDALGGQMFINGTYIQKSDPDFARKISRWRVGMSAAALFCVLLSWLSFRGSRRVAD
jgi:hypothetical protein